MGWTTVIKEKETNRTFPYGSYQPVKEVVTGY